MMSYKDVTVNKFDKGQSQKVDGKDIDFKTLFPNLIIHLGPRKRHELFKKLSMSFKEFKYGPLFMEKYEEYNEENRQQMSVCQIMQMNNNGPPICLSEGRSSTQCDAEQLATKILFDKLRDSFYVIWADPRYAPKSAVPVYALNPDASHGHIFRTVYLKQNSGDRTFPHPVSGAVDYVENYDQLTKYIKAHAKSGTKADLFIFNVPKENHQIIRNACNENGLSVAGVNGCSNMGLKASFIMSTKAILVELLKDGGRNIKYRLIGPRDKYGHNEEEGDKNNFSLMEGSEPNSDYTDHDGNVEINPWIADHLVLMDYITERNEPDTPKEIIFRSVRDCPETEEFIIEKTGNNIGMKLFKAMIDRNVVGIARGFNVNKGKIDAAQSALDNLKRNCYYVQVKTSYLGSKLELPWFLQNLNLNQPSTLYRIASKQQGPSAKILQEFRKSRHEDLYFGPEYSAEERIRIINMAKGMGCLFRYVVVNKYLCIYKRRKPREILQELLSTASKENEKYKLIVPSSRTQSKSNQDQTDESPVKKESQAACSGSEAVNQPQSAPEPPSWVMNFIQSAPTSSHKGASTIPQRKKDEIFDRYNFVELLKTEKTTQKMYQQKKSAIEPDNDPERNLSLSERLQRRLESNSQETSSSGNKRTHDQGHSEVCEPSEKHPKSTYTHGLQHNSSFERMISNGGEASNKFSHAQNNSWSGNPSQMEQNNYKLYERRPQSQNNSWSGNPSQIEPNNYKLYERRPESINRNYQHSGNSKQCDGPASSTGTRSVENLFDNCGPEMEQNSYKFYERRPETINRNYQQSSNSQQCDGPASSTGPWSLENLFDYCGPSNQQSHGLPSKPAFSSTPFFKKKKQRGHSFNKLQKYTQMERQVQMPRRPY